MVSSRLRSLSLRGRVVAGVAVVAVLILLVIAVDASASSPTACGVCHEM
jgi:hypothetical protein